MSSKTVRSVNYLKTLINFLNVILILWAPQISINIHFIVVQAELSEMDLS